MRMYVHHSKCTPSQWWGRVGELPKCCFAPARAPSAHRPCAWTRARRSTTRARLPYMHTPSNGPNKTSVSLTDPFSKQDALLLPTETPLSKETLLPTDILLPPPTELSRKILRADPADTTDPLLDEASLPPPPLEDELDGERPRAGGRWDNGV